MGILPLRPYLKHYSGSQENPRRKTAEYNEMATRVVEHVNALIANNSDEN